MKKKILISCIVIVYMGGVVQGARIRRDNINKCGPVKVLSSRKMQDEDTYEVVLADWTTPESLLDWADSIMQMYYTNKLPGVYIVDQADNVDISVYLTMQMWKQNIPYFEIEYHRADGYYKVNSRKRKKKLLGG